MAPLFTSLLAFLTSSEIFSFKNSNLSLLDKLSFIEVKILKTLSQFSFLYKLKK